jgi:hypothetical protein
MRRLLAAFMLGAPTIFSRASRDGFPTIVSSSEPFFAAVEVAEGRTTVVVSFGLSSSLKKNHLSSRTT